MKLRYATLAVAALCVGATYGSASEDSTAEWLENNAVPKTTETRTYSGSGEVASITRTREYTVTVKQKEVEVRKRGKNGGLQLSSATRTTEIRDAHGGTRKTREANLGGTGLVTTDESETFSSGNVTETVTRKRNGAGQLVTTKRVTRTVEEDGSVVTVVESLNAGGQLVVTRITTRE